MAGRKGKKIKRSDRESKGMKINQSFMSTIFSFQVPRWLILVVLSLVISLMLFPNILSIPKVYKLGDIAETDIKASHDIDIINEVLTEKGRQKAANDVPYVYDFDLTASDLPLRLKEAFSEARTQINSSVSEEVEGESKPETPVEIEEERESFRSQFFQIIDIPLDEGLYVRLEKMGFPEELANNISAMLTQVFERGVVGNRALLISQSQKGIVLQSIQTKQEVLVTDLKRFYDVESARKYIKNQKSKLMESTEHPELVDLTISMAMFLVKPNVTFNKRETELRKELAIESVKPFYYKIKKDEMLVREGEKINKEHLIKLSAESSSIDQAEILGRVPGMTILIGFLLYILYQTGFVKFKSRDEGKELLFNAATLLILFVFTWAYCYIAEEIARGFYYFSSTALLFAMPIACGAILISVFQGIGMAATFSLVISVLASLILDSKVEFFMYFVISSLVAAYGVREYRERGILIKTGLKVGLVNIILSLSIELYYGALFSIEAVVALIAAFVGGILAGVITTGIIPLVEMSFGFTTDIKLLELASLDQPLLKELMVRAPGTYHHSVIVSNMVEATAKAINANPLLARVSAYYHDIGKMKKPLYFIENQMGGENRHEKLAPSMSSLVLISHVKDGVELAKKHKLGKEIIDIIQQHQGKGLITYFHQKAKEQAESKGEKSFQVKEDDFRYPGPKPQTKEAGLVMLADMVEAATRSLADPTPARIQGFVQKIINKAFSDGQLDECELTLKDLHEIAKSFNKTLSGIFHHRIEYPETNSRSLKKVNNGNTDNIPQEDTGAKKRDDQDDDDEGLKRLGL